MSKHDLGNMEYQHFLNIFIDILNKHAPMKQKYLRANQGRFMIKVLHKVIMKRSRLRNKFSRDRTDTSREEYKKQRNLCVRLLKKAKKDDFANLDTKSVTDNKKFWQTVKPLFSNKIKAKTVIKLVENDVIIEDESEIAKIFNEYFVNIVSKVGILTEKQTTYSATNQLSEVEMAIIKYKNHPSIKAITDRMEKLGKPTFNFKFTSHEETEKEVNNLKITLFSKFQCGFRKGFNAQHCLLAMIEKWRKTLDKGGERGAVLTDLSKAFDCIDHNLLIANSMPMYLKNNPSTSFIRTSQSVSKERKSILQTVRGKCYFQVSLKALYLDHYYSIYIYLRYVF